MESYREARLIFAEALIIRYSLSFNSQKRLSPFFRHDSCIGRTDGSEGTEFLERRSRQLVHTRRGRHVELALSCAGVSRSVVQVIREAPPRIRTRYNLVSASEPVGSKAPAFQSDAKSSTYVRTAKSSLALTCSAQASPPPTHR